MKNDEYMTQYYAFIEEHRLPVNSNNCQTINQHHIIPKCVGGTDDENNIAILKPSDHLKAHELLYKAYHSYAVKLAHTLVSMVGKDNCNIAELTDDMLNEYDLKITDAMKLCSSISSSKKRRSIYDIDSLNERRIDFDIALPDGYVEKPNKKDAMIFNMTTFRQKKWDKDAIPVGWKLRSQATKEDKVKLYKNFLCKASTKGACWIHNKTTNKNTLLKKGKPIPEGWVKGIYLSDETKAKQRKCGMTSRKITVELKAKYGGIRWVHDKTTHKNMMIGLNQPIPEGFVEGMFNKKIWELEQQLKALKEETASSVN